MYVISVLIILYFFVLLTKDILYSSSLQERYSDNPEFLKQFLDILQSYLDSLEHSCKVKSTYFNFVIKLLLSLVLIQYQIL